MDPLISVPRSVVTAIADYLAIRPWGEVNELIYRLSQCQPVDPPEVPQETSE